MVSRPTYKELEYRISTHMAIAKNEQEAREISIAWSAYIGGLFEWDVISLKVMDQLADLLLDLENDPSVIVSIGVHDDDDE